MIKIPCLSNELMHSDTSFRDRPEIIQEGPDTFQIHCVGWKLRFKPSGMQYLYEKTSLPSPTAVGLLTFKAYWDKGRVPIASSRALQRFADIGPAEYGWEFQGRVRSQVPVSERGPYP